MAHPYPRLVRPPKGWGLSLIAPGLFERAHKIMLTTSGPTVETRLLVAPQLGSPIFLGQYVSGLLSGPGGGETKPPSPLSEAAALPPDHTNHANLTAFHQPLPFSPLAFFPQAGAGRPQDQGCPQEPRQCAGGGGQSRGRRRGRGARRGAARGGGRSAGRLRAISCWIYSLARANNLGCKGGGCGWTQ